MALTVPDVGENGLLDMMLSDAAPAAQELQLYSAISPAISESTVKADLTEATFTGYAMKPLVRATWGCERRKRGPSGARRRSNGLRSRGCGRSRGRLALVRRCGLRSGGRRRER